MARVTKAQIEEQLLALQAAHQALEQKFRELDTAYDHLQAEHDEVRAQNDELRAQNDALRGEVAQANTRIEAGHQLLRQLKAEHAQVVAQYEAKPKVVVVRKQPAGPRPVVTRFYRGGQLWEKTRVGNQATERLVEPRTEFVVLAGKYDGDEENCKFCDTRRTRADAEALLATVADYPWSRIEERAVA